MATSGDCYSSYARETRFKIHWERDSVWNGNSCGSNLTWILYLENANYWYSNAIKCYPIYINGTQVYEGGTWSNYTASGTYELARGTVSVQHENDGSKQFNINFSGWFYSSYNVSGSADFWLDSIPRYANFTEHYISSTGLNSISVKLSADVSVDWVQYNLNDGGWVDTVFDYTIYNLAPNTTYSIRTRIRRADSGLWTESGYIYGTTKDIAKISSAPNFNLGDSERIQYANPSGSTLHLALYKDNDRDWLAAYRSCSGSEYTFNFTDEELDRIYKAMGDSNSITGRIYLRTNNTYLDYKTVTITLTGNQKTAYVGASGSKRAKVFVGINGSVKRAVMWVGNNGRKRCI